MPSGSRPSGVGDDDRADALLVHHPMAWRTVASSGTVTGWRRMRLPSGLYIAWNSVFRGWRAILPCRFPVQYLILA
jgi:hypothetical protein